MPWRTLTPPDSGKLALSRGGRGFEIGCLMVGLICVGSVALLPVVV